MSQLATGQGAVASIWQCYTLLLKSYRQTWFSLMMVCASLLIACAGLSAVLLINEGAKQSYTGDTSAMLLDASYQITPVDEQSTISFADYANIKRLGFSSAVAIDTSRQQLYTDGQRISQRRVQLIGIDALSLLNQTVVKSAASNDSNETQTASASPNRRNAMVDVSASLSLSSPSTYIHPRFAQELGLQAGQILSIGDDKTLPPLELMAIDGFSDSLLLDIASLLSLEDKQSFAQVLITKTPSETELEMLSQSLPPHLSLGKVPPQQSGPQMTQSFYLNLFAMALLMFAVCLFIVLNAFNLLIYKRFSMLKVLRQLGIGRRQILLAHAGEFILLGALISALGLIVGAQLALLAAPTVRNIVEGLYRVELGFADSAWLSLYIKVLLITLAGVALALFAPIRQLNQGLSQTAQPPPTKRLNLGLFLACAGFAIIALVIFSQTIELWQLLVGAACVILSACCLLILLFGKVLSLIRSAVPKRFSLVRLSLAQALALSQKTKIACCAFFIAVTSNMGMNLMVDSFRASTEGWLEQRLASDYYLYSDDAKANSQMLALAQSFDASSLSITPRFEQSIVFGQEESKDGKQAQQNVQLYSYPTSSKFTDAMVFESYIDDVWTAFAQGSAALVNQQFAIRNNLALGGAITVPHPDGSAELNLIIGGIIYDYGNPQGQILLPISLFENSQQAASIFAIDGDKQTIEDFAAQLSALGIDPDKQLYNTDELLSGSMEMFDRTFVITDGLNAVTLLVASISLACTIVILLDQSRPQTMLLRAIGVSTWQNRGLLLLQYLLLCLVALVCATPFGILLSYILIDFINYYAFNWSYPLVINPADILTLYALSIVVVVSVISLPIVLTTKQSIAQELKWLD